MCSYLVSIFLSTVIVYRKQGTFKKSLLVQTEGISSMRVEFLSVLLSQVPMSGT